MQRYTYQLATRTRKCRTSGTQRPVVKKNDSMEGKQALQTGLVLDDYRGTLDLHELFLLEITEQTRDGFPGSADGLGDLFMGQRQRCCYFALSFVISRRKLQQEAGQLLSCRMREANGSHFRYCGMVSF